MNTRPTERPADIMFRLATLLGATPTSEEFASALASLEEVLELEREAARNAHEDGLSTP